MRTDNVIVTGRASYLKIVDAVSTGGGKPRRTGNLILDPKDPKEAADIKKLRAIIDKTLAEEFPGQKIQGNDCFLRDGNDMVDDDTGEPKPEYKDKFYVSFARAEKKGPARVVGAQNEDIEPGHPNYPYSGAWCAVKLNIYTINGKTDKKTEESKTYGKKICAGLEVIKLVRHGEPLGGGGKAAADDMPEADDLSNDDL